MVLWPTGNNWLISFPMSELRHIKRKLNRRLLKRQCRLCKLLYLNKLSLVYPPIKYNHCCAKNGWFIASNLLIANALRIGKNMGWEGAWATLASIDCPCAALFHAKWHGKKSPIQTPKRILLFRALFVISTRSPPIKLNCGWTPWGCPHGATTTTCEASTLFSILQKCGNICPRSLIPWKGF